MAVSITTRALSSLDQELAREGLALLNRTQGQGLFGPYYLRNQLEGADGFVVGAFREEELVGLASVQLIDRFDYYLSFDPNIARELAGKRVASFNTSSVVEPLQGQGIGRLLMESRLKWVIERNCEVALGVSWVSGLTHTSERTFRGGGFRAMGRVEHFYREMSLANPFDCPGCRRHPCACPAILFRRDFSGSERPD